MRDSGKVISICLSLCAIGVAGGVYVSNGDLFEPASIETLTEAQIFSEGGLSALPDQKFEPNREKLELGRRLFEEKKLSKTDRVSCSSCHDLNFFGADSKPFSVGINGSLGVVNAPTVLNSTYNFRQFWDGRARHLADQVSGPVHNPKEMGSTWPEIISKLKLDPNYQREFMSAFGHEPDENSVIQAIVTFETALTTPNSPFDRYLKGDLAALTRQQVEGFRKFQNYGCVACHQGRNIGGNMYQTLGVMGDYFKDRGGSYPSDLGRFSVTGDPADLHVFRVPSLRNVAMTAPYFHDGQVQNLDQAVRLMAKYQLGRSLSNEDVGDLVSFLNSLTGERPQIMTAKRGIANEAAH